MKSMSRADIPALCHKCGGPQPTIFIRCGLSAGWFCRACAEASSPKRWLFLVAWAAVLLANVSGLLFLPYLVAVLVGGAVNQFALFACGPVCAASLLFLAFVYPRFGCRSYPVYVLTGTDKHGQHFKKFYSLLPDAFRMREWMASQGCTNLVIEGTKEP